MLHVSTLHHPDIYQENILKPYKLSNLFPLSTMPSFRHRPALAPRPMLGSPSPQPFDANLRFC